MKPKKIPMRMCVGCGEMKEKRSVIRIVKNKENDISIDLTGKAAGRGAYMCRNTECLKKAMKARRLERTFSMQIPEEIYKKLEAELNANDD